MATHYKPIIEIWQKKILTFDHCNALISLHFSKKIIFNVAFWWKFASKKKRLRFLIVGFTDKKIAPYGLAKSFNPWKLDWAYSIIN
jgi:hypothetical protein